MEIRVLKYFLTVARVGSITGAANYLHLTQPTLSRQLQDLEKELGHKLFVRTNHNVSLTSEGMILRKRAEEILDMVEKTQNEFANLERAISGEIFIGSGETEIVKYIADVIVETQKDYPNIMFHTTSGNLEEVTSKLDNGLLDFGIVMNPCDSSKYNSIPLPQKDDWGFLIPKDCELAKKEFVTLEDMEKYPLILPQKVFRDYSKNSEFYNWIKDKKDKLNIRATHNLIFNASIMVKQGVGYALTLNNLANISQISSLCFVPLKPKIESGWDIVWKKYQVFSPAAKLFLEKLQKKFN